MENNENKGRPRRTYKKNKKISFVFYLKMPEIFLFLLVTLYLLLELKGENKEWLKNYVPRKKGKKKMMIVKLS